MTSESQPVGNAIGVPVLSIVSDGTSEGTRIHHFLAGYIEAGLSACDIIIRPGEPVRAVLTFEGVELGLSIEERKQKPAGSKDYPPGYKPLAAG